MLHLPLHSKRIQNLTILSSELSDQTNGKKRYSTFKKFHTTNSLPIQNSFQYSKNFNATSNSSDQHWLSAQWFWTGQLTVTRELTSYPSSTNLCLALYPFPDTKRESPLRSQNR
jgi:hypothetical protein